MTFLPRRYQAATFLAALLMLVALPVTWTDQAPWRGVAPAYCQAGGSPDETLNPPPVPTGTTPTTTTRKSTTGRNTLETTRSFSVSVSSTELRHVRWLIVWKYSLASLLRF